MGIYYATFDWLLVIKAKQGKTSIKRDSENIFLRKKQKGEVWLVGIKSPAMIPNVKGNGDLNEHHISNI